MRKSGALSHCFLLLATIFTALILATTAVVAQEEVAQEERPEFCEGFSVEHLDDSIVVHLNQTSMNWIRFGEGFYPVEILVEETFFLMSYYDPEEEMFQIQVHYDFPEQKKSFGWDWVYQSAQPIWNLQSSSDGSLSFYEGDDRLVMIELSFMDSMSISSFSVIDLEEPVEVELFDYSVCS